MGTARTVTVLWPALRTVPERKFFPGERKASSLSQQPPTERIQGVGSVKTSPHLELS